jgi:hypothetical protein
MGASHSDSTIANVEVFIVSPQNQKIRSSATRTFSRG